MLCYGVEPVALEREVFEAALPEVTEEEPCAAVKQDDESGVGSPESGVSEVDGEKLRSDGSELEEVEVARSA